MTIKLPTVPLPAEDVDPAVLLLYGAPKVGKTEILKSLPGTLIIDTEKGAKRIEALKVEINDRTDLKDTINALKTSKKKYDFIALDTIDNIVMWIEDHVCEIRGVQQVGDIEYGGGYNLVRTMTLAVIKEFKKLTDHLIIIGHLKKSFIGAEQSEVAVQGLDLTGKLKNIIMADADSVGLIYREGNDLMVSFITDEHLESGSRDEHLAGKEFKFDWKKIYPNKLK